MREKSFKDGRGENPGERGKVEGRGASGFSFNYGESLDDNFYRWRRMNPVTYPMEEYLKKVFVTGFTYGAEAVLLLGVEEE